MPDFDSIKVAAAKVETTKSDFQIDDVKELHYTLIEGRKAALKDIEEDVKKAYPGNEEKQKEEMKTVDITLKRLERGYRHKARKDVEDFGKLADQYISDLEHITGVDIKDKTVEKEHPEDFWKDATGWYEEGLAKVKVKKNGVTTTELVSTFEEEVVEDLVSKKNWISEIHKHKDEKGKIADAAEFQTFLEKNQKELRQLVLRPLGSGKYLVDFSNISKEFEKATKESALESDFIAKNIGLADLFSQRTEALTIWGKNGIQTGILDEEYERKNGLKGGYLTPEGSYLTLWHGSVVSLESADSIDDEVTEDLFAGEDPLSESRTERDIEASRHITIVSTKPDGSALTETKVTYTQKVDLTKPTPEILEKHKASLIERRKKLGDKTEDPTKKETFTYKTTITTIDPTVSTTEPVKKVIEATFEATNYSKTNKYESFDEDFDYQGKDKYANILISIPMNNKESYIVITFEQKGKGPKTIKVFESKDLSKIKEYLNDRIEDIDKGWVSGTSIKWEDMEVIELDETCSRQTIDRYLRLAQSKTLPKADRILVRGQSYKHALELTSSTDPITFKDTEISDQGIEDLLLNPNTTSIKFDSNQKLTTQGLFKLKEKVPNITEITLDHVKLTERGALTEIAKFPKLTKLVINRSVIVTSELEAVGSSPSLTQLELIDLPTISDLDVKMMLEDQATKNIKLSKLTTLKITGSRITDKSIQYIKNLTKLTNLDLSGNKGITYKAMQGLIPVDFYSQLGADYIDPNNQNLTLENLNLSNTEIDNAALPYLRYYGGLSNINLENTKIDAKGLNTLLQITNPATIKILNLKGTNISETEFVKFAKKFLELIETWADLNSPKLSKFDHIISPNGKEYTYTNLFTYTYKYKSPKEITAEKETEKTTKFEKLKTKKLTTLKKLFKEIDPSYEEIEYDPTKPIDPKTNKYYAKIPNSDEHYIIGYLDEEEFKIVRPRPGQNPVYAMKPGEYKGDAFTKHLKNYFDEYKKEKTAAAAAKAEAEAKKVEEKKEIDLEKLKEERVKELNKKFKEINENLIVDKKSVKLEEKEEGEKTIVIVTFDIKFNNHTIGSVTTDGTKIQIFKPEESTELEESNLEENLKKLILEYAKENTAKTYKRIHELVKEVQDELTKQYSFMNAEIFIELEDEKVEQQKENGDPYLQYSIYLSSSTNIPKGTSKKINKKKIGYIDDWILSKSNITMYRGRSTMEDHEDPKENLRTLIREQIAE